MRVSEYFSPTANIICLCIETLLHFRLEDTNCGLMSPDIYFTASSQGSLIEITNKKYYILIYSPAKCSSLCTVAVAIAAGESCWLISGVV